MTQKASAATQRRSIGRQLKAAREMHFPDRAKKELPIGEAAAALHVNPRTIRRLEGGEVKPNYLLVKSACALYRLGTEATTRILEMVEQADEDEWHERYRQDISPWLVQLLDLEAVADRIYFYGTNIPGWCQTPSYAAALATSDPHYVGDRDYARRLAEIRARRARNIFDRKGVTVSVVIDEGALLGRVGSDEIMGEQRAHLAALASKRSVAIRVLPFANGARAATRGEFTVLEFDDPKEPDLVYAETYVAGQYSVKASTLRDVRWRYDRLVAQSVDVKEYER